MSVVLREVVEAHGGFERWQRVVGIDASLNFSGSLMDVKGFRGQRRPTLSLDVAGGSVAIQHFDGTDDWWMHSPERVWIQRADGRVTSERSKPCVSFHGHERNTPWDSLHMTWFLGQLMQGYLTIPFLLLRPGFLVREIGRQTEGPDNWDVLEVTYPDFMPGGGRVQRLYFDADRMLKRLDYVAEGLGSGDAHYCYDPKSFDGIIIPTLRRAVKRTGEGALVSSSTSLLLDFTSIRIRHRQS